MNRRGESIPREKGEISLDKLFEPKTVALVGSSKLADRVGMMNPRVFDSVYHNLMKFFRGKTMKFDIGEDVSQFRKGSVKADLAVITLSAKLAIRVLEVCGKNGVKAAIVIPGGFKDFERSELIETASRNGIRVLGPNAIMGVVNTGNGLNTTFEKDLMPKRGGISVLSQSGGVGAALIDWAIFYGEGISKFIWLGDKADVSEVELLDYLGQDEDTKVITMYLESVKDGRRFLKTVRQVTERKPIVVLKGGVSEEAKARALSHTAAISAGSDMIFRVGAKQNGAIVVDSMEKLFIAGEVLEKQPPMKGNQVLIVSNVGGPAVLAADAVQQYGLRLAKLSEETGRRIEAKYPGVESINPLDIIADARADRYEDILENSMAEDQVSGVMVINMLKSCLTLPEDVKVIAEVASRHPDKPIVDCIPGGDDYEKIRETLSDTTVPVFNTPDKAVFALKILSEYGEYLSRIRKK
ncbi:MAG: CoA-binding protein [Candidatus Atabeyarchaeum deiterrae]